MEAGSEYAGRWHQCTRCGCTYRIEKLKLVHRDDPVMLIKETVWVCIDVGVCERMKLSRDELARQAAVPKLAPKLAPRPTVPVRRRR